MKQSSLQAERPSDAPLHVAIIMDGNGRWARERGLPRTAGHREGARAVRRTIEAAPSFGISTLTLYAFSSDNWGRPEEEVRALMTLFEAYLRRETRRCLKSGVRLQVIGRRDRLGPALTAAIERAEAVTRGCRTLHLRLAVDYSARASITDAARACRLQPVDSPEAFARELAVACRADPATPDVDLLIRTSGEQRLSDFLLWEVAYAEFVFTPRYWPEFDGDDLGAAVAEFRGRERRFGEIAGTDVAGGFVG